MAQTQTKKKTSSAAKGRAKTGAAQKKSGRRAPQPPEKKPIRREVGGVVFLALALFSGVGYVPTEAIFIHFFANLLKGLFGYGFWLIPPAFLITGLILLLHRGRPVRLRVACMLVVPVGVGALLQVLLCREEFDSAFWRRFTRAAWPFPPAAWSAAASAMALSSCSVPSPPW